MGVTVKVEVTSVGVEVAKVNEGVGLIDCLNLAPQAFKATTAIIKQTKRKLLIFNLIVPHLGVEAKIVYIKAMHPENSLQTALPPQ